MVSQTMYEIVIIIPMASCDRPDRPRRAHAVSSELTRGLRLLTVARSRLTLAWQWPGSGSQQERTFEAVQTMTNCSG